MDNTRVMPPNAMAYRLANDKANGVKMPALKKGAHHSFDHQKGLSTTATPYKICGDNGVHMLMNTQSCTLATNLQFVMPKATKTALCKEIALPTFLSNSRIVQQTALLNHTQSLLTPVVQQLTYITNANGIGSEMPQLVLEKKKYVSQQSSGNVSGSKDKFHGDNHSEPSGEEGTIVNTFKNLSSWINRSFIRPIIDKTTKMQIKIGGTDSAKPSSPVPMSPKPMLWNETSNGSPSNNNHKTQPIYCDNRSSDSFSYSSEQSNIFVNFMPETYLDCDDYIDGGEDTIDFVAASTKIPWNSYSGDLVGGSSIHSSPSDNDYYDCVSKFETELPVNKQALEQATIVQPQHESEPEPELVKEKTIKETKLNVVSKNAKSSGQNENVQYGGDESTVNCPKYVQPNRTSYRRKRRGRRKHKAGANNRKKGNGAPKKNQHEKLRHEVEMNIHDDIDDCFIVNDGSPSYAYEPDGGDSDLELEIIDLDDEKPTCSAPLTAPIPNGTIDAKVGVIETPIPSPEKIPFGRMFTQFFRFDNACKRKLLPFRCTQKQVPHVKPVEERPTSYRRTSETESDDSFIVFEDNKRQRQLSECSDDFILFTEDDADYSGKCDTTDEDFTDSTDDSDNSDDESGDESDCSEYSANSRRKHDNNQPDSGFEEKKVTFNLCPKVHEIRAWKYAYSEARKGKWEQMGRDRERFEKRINELSRILSPVLKAEHRQKIFEQRFSAE